MSFSDIAHLKDTVIDLSTPSNVQTFLEKHKIYGDAAYKPSRVMRLALFLLTNIKTGTIHFTLPDGHTVKFTGDHEGPHGEVTIHNERAVRRFLIGGHLGWCESYLERDWSSPDMAAFFEVILRNADTMRSTFSGRPWVRFLSRVIHNFRANTVRGSRKNIYAHYDIGNDFYKKWLDRSMTYSSALFKKDDDSLEDAQTQKYKAMEDSLMLKDGMSVLEIGCGWGGFAEFLGRNNNVSLKSITISPSQYAYASKRMKDCGLRENVEIILQDYRKVEGRFDRIASIEMFEAVGEKYWPLFFNKISRLLKPEGKAVIQTITISDAYFSMYRKQADYIQRYIFPGGMLPSLSRFKEEASKAGLKTGEPLEFGKSYAKTLAIWNKRFQKSWDDLQQTGFDERFKRLWEQYLAYCQAGFAAGNLSVMQIPLYKI